MLNKKVYYKEKFAKLKLGKESISDIEFEECEFKDCSFVDTKLHSCKFINCKFTGSVISAVDITNSRFVEITFLNCKAIGIDWTKAQSVKELVFEGSQINYSNFRQLELSGINIISCEAKEVDFAGTDISKSILTNSDFTRSIFAKTNLFKSDLRGAKNYCIDTKNNFLKLAKFSLPEALSLLNSLDIIIE